MAAGNHRLSMDEYKQLSELLRKAESDGRLGEAMVFSGIGRQGCTCTDPLSTLT